jgi:DNA-binding transcriptional LysR family regulator
MNNMHVSYSSVVYLLAVVKHMSMSRAAKELFISQAALSQSISKLESGLGITLFYRDKGKLILSKDAEILMPYFENLRRSHDALLAEALTLSSPLNNTINIGYSGSAYTFSILFYSNVLNSYQNGNIQITYITNPMALNLLLAGHLDFVISTTEVVHPLVSSIELMTEPIGVALPCEHPFASKEMLTLDDLKMLDFHGLSIKHSFRQLCDEICRSQQISLHYVTEDDYDTYWKRLFNNKNMTRCAFLSTTQNFAFNLKPTGNYVFKDIENHIFYQSTNIYFLPSEKKHLQHEELIRLIQTATINSTKLTSKFSNLIHEDFLEP